MKTFALALVALAVCAPAHASQRQYHEVSISDYINCFRQDGNKLDETGYPKCGQRPKMTKIERACFDKALQDDSNYTSCIADARTDTGFVEDDSGEGVPDYCFNPDGSRVKTKECLAAPGKPRAVAFRATQQAWQCNDLRVTVTHSGPFTWNYDIGGTIWGGINFTSDGPNLYLRGIPCVPLR